MNIIEPLLEEHQIIRNTMAALQTEIDRIKENQHIDPVSIYMSIDFIRTYAELVHHGKEENILFANLEEKNLSSKHHAVMNELIAEHLYSREISNKCLDAAFKYFEGEDTAQEICGFLEELILCYPDHMQKEDKLFSGPVLEYFTPGEQEKMIREFEKYDTKTLHWKYRKVEPALIERLNHLRHANWEMHATGFPGALW